jgi:hypothetical protein
MVVSRIYGFMTMLYDTQNVWGSGLCPFSKILNARKENALETGSVSVLMDIYYDSLTRS